VVAPDVFVVCGTTKQDRSSYFVWREPKGPDFVLEITSKSTRGEDQGPKKGTYAFLGVQEYVQYDPTEDYLKPPLKGFHLVGDNYQPIPTLEQPDGTLILHSAVLGLDVRLQDGVFHFVEPATGRPLLTYSEADAARQAAEQERLVAEQARLAAEQARLAAENQLQAEVTARIAAEARIAELEARLRRLEQS